MARKAAAAINPRSARAVLFLRRRHGELPARDLSWADLNRLAYQRAIRLNSRKRPPDLALPADLQAIADELVRGGYYARDETPEPAAPAEEPEV